MKVHSKKIQASAEYLMNYAWAIAVITITLAALVMLNVFNIASLAPRATAGACQVYRPAGPYSIFNIGLVGTCTGELPKYVGIFSGGGAYFSAGNSIMVSPEAGANGKMSLCMWYFINSLKNYGGLLLKGQGGPSSGNVFEYALDQANQGFMVWSPTGSSIASGSTGRGPSAKNWTFSCFTYDYAAQKAYYFVNGNYITGTITATGGFATAGTGNLVIGYGKNGYSNIRASNIQLYNTSLSLSELQALYAEGIGGAPIHLQNIVGWWPLNGNANDYSGNNNTGVGNSMTYQTQ